MPSLHAELDTGDVAEDVSKATTRMVAVERTKIEECLLQHPSSVNVVRGHCDVQRLVWRRPDVRVEADHRCCVCHRSADRSLLLAKRLEYMPLERVPWGSMLY